MFFSNQDNTNRIFKVGITKLDKVSKKLERLYRDNLNEIITDEEYHKYSREFIEEREALKRQQKIMQDKIKLIMEKQESSKNDEEMEKYIIKNA